MDGYVSLGLQKNIRTRFAPAPSGSGKIHLGNIRAALINLVYAKQNGGTFVLRVEDTDSEKSSAVTIKALLQDLSWLNILYDEGPGLESDHGPYFQSERINLYNRELAELISKKLVYKCFCSEERLELLRSAQIASKQAPRYDRACFNLPPDALSKHADLKTPYVWRFFVDQKKTIILKDLLRGEIQFLMQNFADFVVCRSNGTFNFLFANFVDDVDMKISHVIRGEDHLSNSALQCLMYEELSLPQPVFMHLPLILDQNGQKLSKSSGNFDLESYKNEGFLPEAICNYLLMLGSSLDDQPHFISEIIDLFDFKTLSTQSVKFDFLKIKSLNHKWIQRLPADVLLKKITDLLQLSIAKSAQDFYLQAINVNKPNSTTLIELFQNSKDLIERPVLDLNLLGKTTLSQEEKLFLNDLIESQEISLEKLELLLKIHSTLSKKDIFTIIRFACIGKKQGLTLNEIFNFLPTQEVLKRVKLFLLKLEPRVE